MSRPILLAGLTVVVVACAAADASLVPAVSPVGSPPPSVATAASPTATPAPIVVAPGEPWLAFQTETAAGYGVHFARPDGTGLHRWSADIPGTQEHPDWSPDGSRVMVNAVDGAGIEDLWVAAADGTAAERLLDCATPCQWVDEAAWSPDGRRIAFQRLVWTAADGMDSTLELLDVASGATQVVLTMPGNEVVLAPRWSPDGERIVVEVLQLAEDSPSSDALGGAIGVVDLAAATPAVTRLTDWSTFANSPDWNATGDRLVHAQASGPDLAASDLVVVRPDGSEPRPVTDLAGAGGAAIHPAFTPDGERILFVLTRPGRDESVMASVGIDGGGLASATGDVYLDGTHPRLRPTD